MSARSPSPEAPSPSAPRGAHTVTSGATAALAAALVADPERFYGSPFQLAWDSKLTPDQRLAALRRWLRGEDAAYDADRQAARLARIRDLHTAIRVVEVHER